MHPPSDISVGQAASAPSFSSALALLKQGQAAKAEAELLQLLLADPDAVNGWLLLAKAQQMRSGFRAMLDSARQALRIAPTGRQAIELELEALVLCGLIDAARDRLQDLQSAAPADMAQLAKLAEVATQIGDQPLAAQLYASALNLAPGQPQLCFNLATAQMALGQVEEAEQGLDRTILADPDDGDAWYNRSTLRRQTSATNHISELKAALPRLAGKPGEMAARFALAKELEDIGEYQESFAQLAQAASLRRSRMQYRVQDDCQTMRDIARTFDYDHATKNSAGHDADAPILVTGLPRSGTTLIDRILSSHDDVVSVGEVNDLALAIMEECGLVQSKAELVRKSAAASAGAIGRNYAARLAQRAPKARRIVDKTPLNFLYIGMLAKALPNATLIHVEREPIDNAYAMFKTLFRMGYPFTYSFDDLSNYMRAQHDLMAHWRSIFPGRIVNVRYEDVVTNQESESRLLLQSAGLEWQRQVLDFHLNRSPVATASAAQVRQPIHNRSIGLWRHYAEELEPLCQRLIKQGLTV